MCTLMWLVVNNVKQPCMWYYTTLSSLWSTYTQVPNRRLKAKPHTHYLQIMSYNRCNTLYLKQALGMSLLLLASS